MFKTSSPTTTLINFLIGLTILTVTTFLIAVIISFNSALSSAAIKSILSKVNMDSVLVELIRSEVHALPPSENLPSLTELSLDLLINIKPKDVRTFLGNEIPGLALNHTEIAVAGQGTNITNLPIESPPPQFHLLEETDEPEDNKKDEDNRSKNKNKTVFIYHSHSWEAYKPLLKNPAQTSSNNEKANVIAVGETLKNKLEDKGIGVEHSKKNVSQALTSRNWNYYQSYALSRETVQEAMGSNDKLKFFIDIHRDAQPKKVTTAVINQKRYAKLFFVVGKEYKNYEKNRAFAEKLHAEIEKKYPGISRGVFVKGKSEGDGVYNQDLTEHALLIEFGGVDNDMTELSNSAEALADVFSEYYWGESGI
ncbi:stage II sporulation protein P [Siminovitchia fortis]|nr:stage II sporulation protein P [Siminovitchia fortis]WHY81991.1 stage II sporulation protein P [Siminovitchia fortis]